MTQNRGNRLAERHHRAGAGRSPGAPHGVRPGSSGHSTAGAWIPPAALLGMGSTFSPSVLVWKAKKSVLTNKEMQGKQIQALGTNAVIANKCSHWK